MYLWPDLEVKWNLIFVTPERGLSLTYSLRLTTKTEKWNDNWGLPSKLSRHSIGEMSSLGTALQLIFNLIFIVCFLLFGLFSNCQQWNVQLGSESQESRSLEQECGDKESRTDNKCQCINSKNNACDLAIITICEVISCEVITLHAISDYGSKWPTLFIQDMSIMVEPKKKCFPALGMWVLLMHY